MEKRREGGGEREEAEEVEGEESKRREGRVCLHAEGRRKEGKRREGFERKGKGREGEGWDGMEMKTKEVEVPYGARSDDCAINVCENASAAKANRLFLPTFHGK